MMLCKVWERGEKNIICLMQHPWPYSLAFFAYAFVKNIIVTKIYIYLEAFLFNVDFMRFPRCCVVVLLAFLDGCYFVVHRDSFTRGPLNHSHSCVLS